MGETRQLVGAWGKFGLHGPSFCVHGYPGYLRILYFPVWPGFSSCDLNRQVANMQVPLQSKSQAARKGHWPLTSLAMLGHPWPFCCLH